MKKHIIMGALAAVAVLASFTEPVFAQAAVVKGGELAANALNWVQTGFFGVAGVAVVVLGVKALKWMGVDITNDQQAQLQSIVVNGLNAAGNKVQEQLRANPNLDINIKSQVVADTVAYVQAHAPDTIKSLGLDPNSGQAVAAIKARIETALNDPKTPTPAIVTPVSAGGVVPAPAPVVKA